MANQYLGEIRRVGFNFAPGGWALCNGQILAISSNTALFSLLGTFYGGNGVNTFALPNLQGRVPIHFGTGAPSTYVIGQTSGAETVSLSSSQLPAHTHALIASTSAGNTGSPAGAYLAADGRGATTLAYNATLGSPTALAAGSVQSAGSGTPVTVLQPYLTVNFVIALTGIFPARN